MKASLLSFCVHLSKRIMLYKGYGFLFLQFRLLYRFRILSKEWYCYLSFNYDMIIPFEEVIKHEAMEGTLPAGRTKGILPEADAVSG